MIKINCDGSTYLELDQLSEFQGELKKRTKKDIDTVSGLIEKYGFSFPFFVWKKGKKNMVLDGHGRILALKKLRENGEEIPALPACYIKARDEEEAKKKLLHLNSQYGVMTAESVMIFSEGINLDLGEINLTAGKIKLEKEVKIEADVPFSEVLGEENNYIVLKFNTDIDFINACTVLDIKQAKAYSTMKEKDNTDRFRKVGIGRVVDGVDAIERIRG